jgi:CRP-like cAMP-binding protein
MGLLVDTLKSIDFLAGSSEEVIMRFLVLGKSRDYPKGHVFWRAGTVPEMVVIPVSGEAKTTTRSPEGREFIDRFLGSGECVGLASALDGMDHPTDAEVVRGGEFFTITRANLEKFLDSEPGIRAKAVQMIGALYRRSLKEREDVALRPVPQRVAEFLVRHACVRQENGARVLVHATQAELAARLGTVREVVARIFADFTQRGLIERGDNGVFIADWDGLHAEAGMDAAETGAPGRGGLTTSPAQRTARFFLPTFERKRRHGGTDETAQCAEHLGDLSMCRERGCPNAVEPSKERRSK